MTGHIPFKHQKDLGSSHEDTLDKNIQLWVSKRESVLGIVGRTEDEIHLQPRKDLGASVGALTSKDV